MDKWLVGIGIFQCLIFTLQLGAFFVQARYLRSTVKEMQIATKAAQVSSEIQFQNMRVSLEIARDSANALIEQSYHFQSFVWATEKTAQAAEKSAQAAVEQAMNTQAHTLATERLAAATEQQTNTAEQARQDDFFKSLSQ